MAAIVTIPRLCLLGLLLSIYSLYIEYQLETNPFYEAACDVASWISCTRAFKSPFAHILYYPNAAYGVGYYLILSALHRFRYYGLMYPLTLLAALASVFLLGVLLHMRDICIVCVSVHIVNFTVLHITWNLATGHGKALNSGSKVD
eukprot:TRINITY_DN9287_c1_g1_i1.p1 TRINITY_DN9287_c1_g1~~TRINITY_DN9287_c1_g1_i1.p1  ORF type:complete len:156 (+),score=65.77 TRINITY_DN9287_c1_g1_i1:31-468(+)